ncbi:MAG: DUF3656 domain-containing protein [Planctomycetales bacterium]|nr:DUF3656 domain-containing protein [Planctomycetales bacterium]
MTSPSLPRPELLAPAGDRECLRAAVENGADAVYFGLNCGFNARARATNIEPDELADVMAMLHHRGVKGYVTLNTLAFSDELPELERLIRRIAIADVDAVLVQDLGVVRLIRAICPDLPIHASTQMTLTSAECIRVAEELGIERVVLPRELSIREIAKLKSGTSVELEAFVHGALCVAYSGQCLTSESLGGRSANRGQCAQACRLPYDLICDGEDVDLGDQKYLLSPQDLAAYDLTTDLIAAGVRSFKIEGRLKTPEYVANITKHYRAAIDAAVNGEPVEFTRDEVREMELSFSRGFSPGWLNGDDHKMLVPGFSSSKRGVLLGEIVRVYEASVEVRLSGPIARGDGIVFQGDREANAEQGGRVFGIFSQRDSLERAESGVVELEFQRGGIDFGLLEEGHSLWKTDDPQLTSRLRKTFTGPDPLRKRPLDVRVRCVAGERLELTAFVGHVSNVPETITGSCTLETCPTVRVKSLEPLPVATKHAITSEFLREQLSRLGNTAYELRQLDAEISGGPMVPLSVLSKLRQELVAKLDDATKLPRERRLCDGEALTTLRSTITDVGRALLPVRSSVSKPDGQECPSYAPRLHVLCRTLDQLRAATLSGPQPTALAPQPLLYADFADIREYREAVAIAHDAGALIYLATPRIQKPDEMGLFRALLKHEADGILVRNLSGMRFYADEGVPFVADYSLNATNELTSQFLIGQQAQRVTASYDMNRDQLLGLVEAVPPEWLEVVVHQHMPMFHMEHCVFCAVLSPGTNKHNCGRPCDTHLVQLRDRVGSEHPLHADVGCRNTLFNAVPQSGAEVVASLLERGVQDFRIELLEERPNDIPRVLNLYRDLLANRIRGEAVWRQLNASNRVGVTRGTLEERRNPLAIL